MKYKLMAENSNAIFTIWEGEKSPTIGNAYFAMLKAEALGFFFPLAKAYRGRKFLRDFTASDINNLIRSKWRVVTK